MRVLLPTTDYPPMGGGIQLLLRRLVECAPETTFDVMALGDEAERAWDHGRDQHVVRVARRSSHRLSVSALNAAVFRRATTHRYDAILSGHLVTGPGSLAVRRTRGTSVVQYVYAKELSLRPGLARTVLGRADATIAISRYTCDAARAAGADDRRIHVVHPGVDLPVANEGARQRDSATILTVARLEDRYKGFDVMLRALPLVMSKISGARWVVVGDGRLRPELEATAAAWGLSDRVLFAGSLPDAERDAWLDQATVFAMPSRTPSMPGGGEGFGIVYLEAGSHGLPCLCGDSGGAADAILDDVTGIHVNANDHVAVADGLVRLLSDPGLAQRLGDAGLSRARELSWRRMALQVQSILRQVAGR
jgi:phosphatidyl-myo-inositol dimannoside synthase